MSCCIEDLDDAVLRLSVKRVQAEEAVRATFAALRQLLDAREQDLLLALTEKCKDKQKKLGELCSCYSKWFTIKGT